MCLAICLATPQRSVVAEDLPPPNLVPLLHGRPELDPAGDRQEGIGIVLPPPPPHGPSTICTREPRSPGSVRSRRPLYGTSLTCRSSRSPLDATRDEGARRTSLVRLSPRGTDAFLVAIASRTARSRPVQASSSQGHGTVRPVPALDEDQGPMRFLAAAGVRSPRPRRRWAPRRRLGPSPSRHGGVRSGARPLALIPGHRLGSARPWRPRGGRDAAEAAGQLAERLRRFAPSWRDRHEVGPTSQ